MKPISPTERKVLELIATGMSTSDVADALSMSKFTVLSHRRSLLGKFGVKNSVELVTRALIEKVIDPDISHNPNNDSYEKD